MRQRPAQFGQFFFRSVDFKAAKRGDSEGLVEQVGDIREMRESAFGIGVAFPAMRGLAIKRETVIEALFLVLGLSDEFFAESAKGLCLVRREIRDNCAALIFGRHLGY